MSAECNSRYSFPPSLIFTDGHPICPLFLLTMAKKSNKRAFWTFAEGSFDEFDTT